MPDEEPEVPEIPQFDEDELEGLQTADPTPFRRNVPLEDEPSGQIAVFLLPTEKFRGEWRHHWIAPAKTGGLIVVYAVLLVILAVDYIKPQYLAAIVSLIVGGALLGAAYRAGRWFTDRLVLTNMRVMLIKGLVGRNVAMVPLVRVTDMRYLQSPLARLLNYGTFRIESVTRRSGLRNVGHVPNPNELYLRIVEEMYDPETVEQRLGGVVSSALREALGGTTLVNYDGWISVELRAGAARLEPTPQRELVVAAGEPVELTVTIAADRLSTLAEPLIVRDGEDRDEVEFTVELDSDVRALRSAPVEVRVGRGEAGRAAFRVVLSADELALRPWLWIRVSQQHNTLQSVELMAVESVEVG